RMLAEAEGSDDPVVLPESVLAKLTKEDLPLGVSVNVGNLKDGFYHLDWAGWLYVEGDLLVGEADFGGSRKYWYSPLGLEQYMDLVRRAVETRHRMRGDARLTQYEDDGTYIELRVVINTSGIGTLADAYKEAVQISDEIQEAVRHA